MLTDDQLRHLSRCKQVRRKTFSIGELLREQMAGHSLREAAVLRQIRSVLEPLMDKEFQKYCEVAGYHRGQVTVRVNNPAAVASMRRKYLFVLRERLQEALPEAHVRNIHFAALA